MWRREERGARLEKMVRETNRRNEILTGVDETIFIFISRLFLIVPVGLGKAICSQSTINVREMSYHT